MIKFVIDFLICYLLLEFCLKYTYLYSNRKIKKFTLPLIVRLLIPMLCALPTVGSVISAIIILGYLYNYYRQGGIVSVDLKKSEIVVKDGSKPKPMLFMCVTHFYFYSHKKLYNILFKNKK